MFCGMLDVKTACGADLFGLRSCPLVWALAAGLAFVLGIAAAAASIWLLAAVVWGISVSFADHALVVGVLVAALAGIIALVRRCGVSPAWPILGFVIFLLFIAWFALSWSNGTGTLTPDIDT